MKGLDERIITNIPVFLENVNGMEMTGKEVGNLRGGLLITRIEEGVVNRGGLVMNWRGLLFIIMKSFSKSFLNLK